MSSHPGHNERADSTNLHEGTRYLVVSYAVRCGFSLKIWEPFPGVYRGRVPGREFSDWLVFENGSYVFSLAESQIQELQLL
jgi:hypothetical protein